MKKLMLLCLGLALCATTWADLQEKNILKTNFSDWAEYTSCADKGVTTTTATLTTKYSKEVITFTLHNTNIYEGGGGKVGNICSAPSKYLCAMKESTDNATITTSAISDVRWVIYTHRATGSSRGWGLKVKGDGDADWVTVYSTTCGSTNATTDTIKINRTNVQLQWYNLSIGNYAALTDLVINGNVEIAPRTFTDFKVDFRTRPYTVVAPEAGLPAGVAIDTTGWNGNQHGATGVKVVVPVDGPVKFTIGGCQYGNDATVTNKAGVSVSLPTKAAGCDNGFGTYTKFVTYTYNVEAADTLTFSNMQYCPYFFAEMCDYVEQVLVTYYDTDGKTVIGTDTVDGGSELKFKYSATDVNVPAGQAFRGWFAANAVTATKVVEGTALDKDMKLYAKASEIEHAEVGSHFNWDLMKNYFYVEDHEAIQMPGGAFHDVQHGWTVGKTNSIRIAVGGKAYISIKNCKYSKTQTATATTSAGTVIDTFAIVYSITADGALWSFKYDGPADTLTITYPQTGYVHGIEVYNVASFIEKDAATGYYTVPASDGATLMMLIKNGQKGDKIFVPNGTYDFGETCLTSVPDSISIIGESQNGVLIKNSPLEEGIAVTATLLLTGNNIYIQDLSLQCSSEKCATPSASRCVVIQDKGTNNICKNVSLLSGQDTYYSNGSYKQRAYFENCYITGTVDFLCGGGDVVFNKTKLYVLDRSTANVIVAANTDALTQYGYVLVDDTIDCAESQVDKYAFGRPWNNSPAATWINTTVLKKGSDAGYIKMTSNLVIRYHEYNTKDAAGNAITSHNLNACTGAATSDAIYLTQDQAAKYAIDSVFKAGVYEGVGAWAPVEIAQQVTEIPEGEGIFLVDGAITTVKPTSGTVRVANARGGFGPAIPVEATALDQVEATATVNKVMVNGQLMIQKGDHLYNAQGMLLK